MALMKCPDCQTDISTEAPACPKCGRPNAGLREPPVVYSARPEQKRGTIPTGCSTVIIIIAAIVGFVLYFANTTDSSSGGTESTSTNSSSGSGSQTTAAPDESRPVQTYTAEQLYAMFHANEIKADQTIGDAVVRFTGVIASIQKSDFSNTPELQIRANCFNPYDCEDPDAWNTFEADLRSSELSAAASLRKGQTITLQCNKVSMPLDVYVQGCVIVRSRNSTPH